MSRLTLLCALLAGPAAAQLSALAPVTITPPGGTAPVRWPDVAFSSTDDVFLAVSGAANIQGQYLSTSGTALGPAFVVNSGVIFGQAPRVTWASGPNAFLVTWHESIGNDTRIRGRVIRHGQTALTDDFDISPFGTNWEMGATVAWSTTSSEFLVGWQDRATTHIHVQRVSITGALAGTVITVEAVPYARDPSIAWDADTDRFLIASAGCVGNDDCFVHAQRLQAGSGALVGGTIVLQPSVRAGYVPEVAYNALTHQFLVVWFRVDPSGNGLYASTVDSAGVAGPVIAVSAVGSYDANSVAWNPVSNTFVVVTHSTSSQDLALELSATGQPLEPAGVFFGSGSTAGNFNPRVAASTSGADWLTVTSSAFATLSAQRLTSLTPEVDAGPEPEDAGSPDAGVTTDAGQTLTPDAGTNSPSPDAGTNIVGVGACGCTSSPEFASLLALVALLSFRRAGRCR